MCNKGKWVPKLDQSTSRRLNPGCQWLYNPSRTAIINRKWSLNVKISKVGMPQYECIIPKMGKSSVQNKPWEVCVWHKLSSQKIISDEWAMPQCKHLWIKHPWEEYNQSYIIWSKWTSAHQSHRGNVKRISDLPQRKSMSQCELISLRSTANERVMPQYRANPEMTKLRCMLS